MINENKVIDSILLGSLDCTDVKKEYLAEENNIKIFDFIRSWREDHGRKMFDDYIELGKACNVSSAYLADRITGVTDLMTGIIQQSDIDEWVEVKKKQKYNKLIASGDFAGVTAELLQDRKRERESLYSQWRNYVDSFGNYKNSYLLGTSTGIEELDRLTAGMIRGNIWVCGGYYGSGKTYLLINLLYKALLQNKKVMFITLEMSRVELICRLICRRAGLDYVKVLKEHLLNHEEKERRDEAERYFFEKIELKQLQIVDNVYTINEIKSKLLESDGIDVVGIDYIQIIQAEADGIYNTMRVVTSELQEVTKVKGFTLILLSQMNNTSQNSSNSVVDGFKGAGEIGQIANVGLVIERHRLDNGKNTDEYKINVTKVRHGSIGQVNCRIVFPGGIIVQDGSNSWNIIREEYKGVVAGKDYQINELENL